jgi:large subunit ribosomal protein L15
MAIPISILHDLCQYDTDVMWRQWLAITHKSFDHGRRGFNDRLAFLGKRMLDVQTSLALLNAPQATPPSQSSVADPNLYQNEALDGVDNISKFSKAQVLSPARLAGVARKYGVEKVVRWKPRKSDNLQSSGVDTVLAHTLYSIIGALALQRGGDVASKIARDRILQPLGLR